MRRFGLILSFITIALHAFAIDKDDFKSANDLYGKKNYAEALDKYKQLINEGYKGASLYYNTGNAYYKTGDWLKALLYYEKAAMLKPRNEDIRHNIDFMNKYVVDEFETHPSFGKVVWFNSLMSSNTAAWLSLLVLLACFVLAYLYYKSKAGKVLVWSLLALVVFCSFAFYSTHLKSIANKHLYALVMDSSTKVRSEPETGEQLFVIHEGTKVKTLEFTSGWVKVKLPDGNVGWILEESLGVI